MTNCREIRKGVVSQWEGCLLAWMFFLSLHRGFRSLGHMIFRGPYSKDPTHKTLNP